MKNAASVGLAFCLVLASSLSARAHEFYAGRIPNRVMAEATGGFEKPCITCHNNPDGGAGCVDEGGMTPCLNPFGLAFRDSMFQWTPMLAGLDSDGDLFSNGEELQDPTGRWTIVEPSPGNPDYVTAPGSAASSPGETDADSDGYCWFGQDMNGDGDCLDPGEDTTESDCNDSSADVHSGQDEDCTNPNDANCDGFPTLTDMMCVDVVDRDGDGYCTVGRDMNRDRDCVDAGEAAGGMDCDDTSITVFPGAQENCVDTLDNDCDGDVDTDDTQCNGEMDADEDGYCPIGRDLNGDGDCLDANESDEGYDCDDMDPLANPDQVEDCSDLIDNDCDGLPNFLDDECASVFDADGDGHCPEGADLNDDRDCVDAGESEGAPDCDDMNPAVSPSVMELCTNMQDDDCDREVDIFDPDCAGYIDADGDRYCFVGYDADQDGLCISPGEEGRGADCNDDPTDPNALMSNPEQPEGTLEDLSRCLNGFDDNCDGSPDGLDPTCSAAYFDFDGDGYCRDGRDLDGSGTCDGMDEQGPPGDEAGNDPSIYPGAPENCLDRRDNDQNGLVDMDDPQCVRDVDADEDGYCPIGQDLNGDGDCLDEGENVAVSDCDDSDPERSPASMEMCRNRRDDDCDGQVDLFDSDCVVLLDRDRDGFCGMGIDDNGDGDCLDLDEDRFGSDCDDFDPAIGPRAVEICDDGIDNDCDMTVDINDSQCPCTDDALCDDGDPCTIDRCDGRGRNCEYEEDPFCGMPPDAGMMDASMEMPASDDGCGCRAAGSGGGRGAWLFVALLGVVLRRRRR